MSSPCTALKSRPQLSATRESPQSNEDLAQPKNYQKNFKCLDHFYVVLFIHIMPCILKYLLSYLNITTSQASTQIQPLPRNPVFPL